MNKLLSDTAKLTNVFFNHFNAGTDKYIVRERVYFALKHLDKVLARSKEPKTKELTVANQVPDDKSLNNESVSAVSAD